MPNVIMQTQLLLAALSALLPLVPAEHRGRAAEVLDIALGALAAGESVVSNLGDLGAKLAAIRAEMESLAAQGERVGADEFQIAMARLRAASVDFRQALAESGAG